MTLRRPTMLAALLLVLAAGCGERDDPVYRAEIDGWHAERIERLAGEEGWLTLVGLHPLRDGTNRIGSAPAAEVRLPDSAPAELGVIAVAGGGLVFTAAADAAVRMRGDDGTAPVTVTALATDADGPPTVLEAGSLVFYAIARGDLLFLRVKDRESAVRRDFTGVERYPVATRWRVTARLEPHDPPRTLAVPNVLGQIDETPSPGVLVFEIAGRACRLEPMGGPGEPLFLVFGDATNGHATYGGGRFLSADAPGPDGSVVLDFNKAVNPPCVFTSFATCPLPPEGNVLAVAVEAGEKMWGSGH